MSIPPSSYDDLMAQQHTAAVEVTGAHHSNWNGKMGPTRKVENGVILGTASWDSGVLYDDKYVTGPLKEMFEHKGVQQEQAKLLAYRNALKTVLHENSHMTSAEGTTHADAMHAFQQPPVRALEEGVTEAWSYANLDQYIDKLDLEKIAPGIKEVQGRQSYPQFAPAANALANRIGEVSGVDSNEVLRRMNVVNGAEKWPIATKLVTDAAGLDKIVPPAQLAEATQRVEQAMQAPFGTLADVSKLPADQQRPRSAEIGNEAFDAGQKEIAAIKQEVATTGGLQPKVAEVTAQTDGKKAEATAQTAGADPKLAHAMAMANSGTAPLQGVQAGAASQAAVAAKPAGPAVGRGQGLDRD
ncbi:hypothetical protein OG394_26550 [Kribbella sp. NBC_01245]|uniref:hypothetical protein n=1 Tax=Kribbella sp. NBC_01245 TaxID=2903578 RepID=UPI002E2924CE|nr:hypothetical protein [Kribbella sp. NBC_01245]